jgi:hypothetical protein
LVNVGHLKASPGEGHVPSIDINSGQFEGSVDRMKWFDANSGSMENDLEAPKYRVKREDFRDGSKACR